jgi:hypothetical protein
MEESHNEINRELECEFKVTELRAKYRIQEEQFRKMKEAFDLIDTDGSGIIDVTELSEGTGTIPVKRAHECFFFLLFSNCLSRTSSPLFHLRLPLLLRLALALALPLSLPISLLSFAQRSLSPRSISASSTSRPRCR